MMVRPLFAVSLVAALALSYATPNASHSQSKKAAPGPAAPVVVLTFDKGVVEIETLPDAPKSVERFLELSRRGFYRGHRVHWVQPGLVQMGDPFSRDMTKRTLWGTGGSGPGLANRPIGVAETSKRPFVRGIVGLAYRSDRKPDTGDSQFFILRAANPPLTGKYAPLGRVITGMNVVDKIVESDIIKNVTVR
jgi:cyclophilin family peptidyl-prolyl cis-trans isomerase